MNIIETSNLTRRYGSRRGIERVSLAVGRGEIFGFLGPNGAGKTTTIRVLLGFLRPTGGDARIFGLDCWRRSATIKTDVGYVPGDLRLPAWLNGNSALHIFGAVRGRDIFRAGRELAERFGLDMRVRVRSMSRGMRQKLGLILALAHRPRVLVLDEPTASLDPLMQQELRDQIRALASDGHTIFFSSHTLSEVEQLCDRVAIVREGKLVAQETLSSLRSRAGHDVMIRWRNAGDAHQPVPAFLRVRDRAGATWECELVGPIDELTRWLATRAVEDLTIGRPDLETLFRRFYEDESSAGAAR
jgi:ABC-2 type transport system ATP-binding protein